MFKKSLITLLVSGAVVAQADQTDDIRLVFEYNQGKKDALVNEVKAVGGQINIELDEDNSFAATISKHTFKQLKQSKVIKSVEIDAPRKFVPSDFQTEGFSDFAPYGLAMVQADQLTYQGGIKVCIMDTGYSLGHSDLPSTGVDGDSEGAGPWNVDGHGHGTHVAGTVAALDGNGGLTGVLGSGSPELHIVRVFDSGGGFVYASDLAGAASDCVDAGAKVINMSLGGAFATKIEQRAFDRVEKAGVISVAAAGNDGNSTHSYPASYDSVVSVAAVDDTETVADFSQTTTQVELAAPGVDVISTYPGNSYASASGTSMASPHTAGVTALVWSHFPNCNNYEIRNALGASAKDLGDAGRDYSYGYGLVQAKAAYDYLMANGCDGKGMK